MRRLQLIALALAILGCTNTNRTTVARSSERRTPVQLYLFNKSGQTVDLRVSLGDSVLYYAQVRSIVTASEISGSRLVGREPGTYQVIVNDLTHAQQITREISVGNSPLYIVVTTRESGSELSVSLSRPF